MLMLWLTFIGGWNNPHGAPGAPTENGSRIRRKVVYCVREAD